VLSDIDESVFQLSFNWQMGLAMSSSTRVWQQEPSKQVFRFQTVDEGVHLFLSQRRDVTLVGWGVNFRLWIYIGKFNSLKEAEDTLRPALISA
jgi:hypothetical protein